MTLIQSRGSAHNANLCTTEQTAFFVAPSMAAYTARGNDTDRILLVVGLIMRPAMAIRGVAYFYKDGDILEAKHV